MIEQLQNKLQWVEYRERPEEVAKLAKENWIVIAYPYSDDLVELQGALEDEAFMEQLFYHGWLYKPACESDDCPHERIIQDRCKKLVRDDETFEMSANFPIWKFDVMERWDNDWMGNLEKMGEWCLFYLSDIA
jgi:hypothetical protein